MLLLLTAVLGVAPLDVTGCKTSKQDVGSLHANTMRPPSHPPVRRSRPSWLSTPC